MRIRIKGQFVLHIVRPQLISIKEWETLLAWRQAERRRCGQGLVCAVKAARRRFVERGRRRAQRTAKARPFSRRIRLPFRPDSGQWRWRRSTAPSLTLAPSHQVSEDFVEESVHPQCRYFACYKAVLIESWRQWSFMKSTVLSVNNGNDFIIIFMSGHSDIRTLAHTSTGHFHLYDNFVVILKTLLIDCQWTTGSWLSFLSHKTSHLFLFKT